MKAENKIFNNTVEEINGLTEETIDLLKKLIEMIQSISITTSFGTRVDATTSSLMDGISSVTNVSGVLYAINNCNQLGSNGIVISQSQIKTINSSPINGGWDYMIGDIITLSGGSNGSVMVIDLYDKSIKTINSSPINGGSGYTAGEIITLVNRNGNGINGSVIAYSVDNNGSVVELTLLSPGYDYYVGEGIQSSTSMSGSGLIVDITSTIENIGPVKSIYLYNTGSGYAAGNMYQLGDPVNLFGNITNGKGIVISILEVDTGYGNINFLQNDVNRWLYTDMIRKGITF
jgi:hypothetical protein